MEKEAIRFESVPAPDFGEAIYEREFPSETSLVAAVVLRLTDFLEKEGYIETARKTAMKLCLDEALKNAMLHGNNGDADLRVTLKVHRAPAEFWIVISDQGKGFDLEGVPDPIGDFGVWQESGRGIHLMQHYTKAIQYWSGGSTLAMCFAYAGGGTKH
jgi:anti-sigma regulatory factor (Ser/Thr protein kinase)